MQALEKISEHFPLLKLSVTLQFQGDVVLPAYKGSLLRGWFGQALKQVDEHAFFVLFGEHENRQPKPYMLTPGPDHKTQWSCRELYQFELTLFGEAVHFAGVVLLALSRGESLGLGHFRVPVRILSVASVTPVGLKAGPETCYLADYLAMQPVNLADEPREIALNLQTPLRIKVNGRIHHREIQNINQIINQVLRRLVQLCRFWVVDDDVLFDALYRQTPVTRDMTATSQLYFEDWQRYSCKQAQLVPYGGLKGQISFQGMLSPLLPLLQIGELLQIGGKTTFGLGKYQLIQ